jgi:hypothetical protein
MARQLRRTFAKDCMPVEAWANTVRSLLRPDRLAWAVLNAQRGQGLRPGCCRACGPPWSALRTVAASPVKLILLAGGSALITLAYIGGLAASVQAFGGHAGITEIGAVYLGAAVIAAASPPPAASAPSRPPWSRAGPASAYSRARSLGGPHLPARHLLTARPPRLGRLAASAKTRLHMTPRTRSNQFQRKAAGTPERTSSAALCSTVGFRTGTSL